MCAPSSRRRCFRRSRPAFTLIEMLVITAIMAILISILLPSLGKARESARRTVCLAHLKHIGAGLFSYAAQNRGVGPSVMTPIMSRSPRQLLSRPGERVNLGLLVPRSIPEPEIFHCPSQRKFYFSADLSRLGRAVVAGSYAYAIHAPALRSPRFSSIRHLAMVSDDFAAGPYDPEGIGRYSHRVGYNILYTDGSATWYPDPNQSIWKRGVYWDDETDDVTYNSLYGANNATFIKGSYDRRPDVFRLWWSFCYFQPDPF